MATDKKLDMSSMKDEIKEIDSNENNFTKDLIQIGEHFAHEHEVFTDNLMKIGEQLKQKFEDLTKEKRENAEEIKKLQKAYNDLTEEKRENAEEIEKLKKANNDLTKEKGENAEEIEELKKANNDLTEEKRENAEEIEKLKKEKNDLINDLVKKDESFAHQLEHIKPALKENEDLKNILEEERRELTKHVFEVQYEVMVPWTCWKSSTMDFTTIYGHPPAEWGWELTVLPLMDNGYFKEMKVILEHSFEPGKRYQLHACVDLFVYYPNAFVLKGDERPHEKTTRNKNTVNEINPMRFNTWTFTGDRLQGLDVVHGNCMKFLVTVVHQPDTHLPPFL